jgi:hypothetical protein
MKLREQIAVFFPLSSEKGILAVMQIIKDRNIEISKQLVNYLAYNTQPRLFPFLKSELEKYQVVLYRGLVKNMPKINLPQIKSKKLRKDPNKSILSKGGLSEDDAIKKSMFSFRTNSSETLSSQGYEYGLSDW